MDPYSYTLKNYGNNMYFDFVVPHRFRHGSAVQPLPVHAHHLLQ